MTTIRDLFKKSGKQVAKGVTEGSKKFVEGTKETYNKVLDTEITDIQKGAQKGLNKATQRTKDALLELYAIILSFIVLPIIIVILIYFSIFLFI